MNLALEMAEAEISLLLVKSDWCIIFSSIIMKSTTQQCKNETTSFYHEVDDQLVCSLGYNDLEGCNEDQKSNFYSLGTNMRGGQFKR